MPKLSHTARDAWSAVAIGVFSVFIFIALMGSVVMMGQAAGEHVRLFAGVDSTQTGEAQVTEVPVLCYHYIRGATGPVRVLKVLGYVVLSLPLLNDMEIWTQSENAFAKQMRYLHDNGYESVTLEQVAAWREGRFEMPEKPVAITFDDGDRSTYDYAFPILKKYGFKATVFVVTDKVGKEWEGIHGVTWQELREMHESGVFSVQSHTNDMHFKVHDDDRDVPVFLAASRGDYRIRSMDWKEAVEQDLERSRELIRRNIGTDPQFIAWPYGSGNAEVNEVARECGFPYAVTMEDRDASVVRRPLAPEWKQFEIDRHAITARTSMRRFRAILN